MDAADSAGQGIRIGARIAITLLAFALGVVRAGAAEIRWDEWGVPHIAGRDVADALYGFGWAQMRAHANLELRLVARTRGISAEILGAGDQDADVNSDRWVRLMGVPQLARSWLPAQTAAEREILQSFVAGLNAYAAAHPQEIEPALRAVLPIKPVDVLARLIDLTLYTLAISRDELNLVVDRLRRRGGGDAPARAAAAGSNGWAIGQSHASGAAALLLVNPHLPWAEQTRLVEADLSYPDVHIYGATFVGFPFVAVGFNRDLGWTHTVNPMHSFYLYLLRSRNDGYYWNGRQGQFAVRDEHIRVRRLGGYWIQDEPLKVRASVQGPVVAEQGDRLMALWVPGRDSPHLIGQYWEMARARNLGEFQQALRQEQAPLFSTIYADRDGHIYYNFGGRNPTGPASASRRQLVLDGSDERTLWRGVIPLEQLPSLTDPPTGWIQNANDPPWTATWPSSLREESFPPGLISTFRDFTNLRAQQVIQQLSAEQRVSLDDLIALKHRTHVELADRVLDDLIRAGRRSDDSDARAASEVLAKWDRNVNADSRGASLFFAWVLLMPGDGSVFLHPFDAVKPLSTPQGLGDTAAASRRLGEAARMVKEREGRLDAPWGEFHRLRWGASSAPANGAPDPLGMPRCTTYEPDPDHGGFMASGGDSFVAAVAFGPTISARGLLSYGNFTQEPPPGTQDQFALYSRMQLRRINFELDARARTTLTESPRASGSH
jgi:acyl-homoserine-lactone acylase